MKIIIAGCGKVGYALTRQLSSEGYDITIIDKDGDVLQSTMEHYDVMAVCGNCAIQSVLSSAGAQDADLLIAATGEDEVNLLSCAVAHKMNPAIHTIARIRNPEYSDQIYGMRDVFGLSMAINPERQAALEIERLLKYPGFLNRDTFVKGRVEIVELKIEENSPLCGVPLKKMGEIVRCKVLVCVVLRNGEAIAPDGNFVLEDGDRIFVTAPVNELAALLSGLDIVTKKVKNVIICGGGRVGYYLAERLSRDGFSTKIIESDYKKCTEISAALPSVNVINGDACSHDLLKADGYKAVKTEKQRYPRRYPSGKRHLPERPLLQQHRSVCPRDEKSNGSGACRALHCGQKSGGNRIPCGRFDGTLRRTAEKPQNKKERSARDGRKHHISAQRYI